MRIKLTLLRLIIGLFLIPSSSFAQRVIDIECVLLEPVTGDVIQSPYTIVQKFKIINNGPDTVRYYDQYQLRSTIGVIYITPLKSFPNDLIPGEFFISTFNIYVNGDQNVDSIACCMGISKFLSSSVIDTIVPETPQMLKNNTSCAIIKHIAKGTGVHNEELPMPKVYPNLAQNNLIINLPIVGVFSQNATIYNARGEECKSMLLNYGENIISLQDLSKGIYWIKIEGISKAFKWIKY